MANLEALTYNQESSRTFHHVSMHLKPGGASGVEGMAWEGGATAQSALDQLRASLKVPGDYGGKYDAAPSWGPRASGPSRAEPCFCPVRLWAPILPLRSSHRGFRCPQPPPAPYIPHPPRQGRRTVRASSPQMDAQTSYAGGPAFTTSNPTPSQPIA